MAKSFEVKLNEALEQLKAASATKYAEVCAKLPTVLDAKGNPYNSEAQLKCVEEALATSVKESANNVLGLENIDESKRDFHALFGVEPRKEIIKENLTRPIKKNNGAADNGHGEPIAEVDRSNTKKEALVESVKGELFNGNEASARTFLGLKPKGPEGLTTKQAFDYRFACAIGLSESDAMVVAKLTPIKEVNNNPRY